MPFCDVGNDGVRIFYRTYGGGPVKVLLIIGLAATHEGWGPQIRGLAGTDRPNDGELDVVGRTSNGAYAENGFGGGGGIEVCALDNRGIGRSSIPAKKSEYSTEIMAKDAIAVLDHLGWKRAHVFGHSMGAMIACKLAAMVPRRVNSLALLNVTGGGFECLPRLDRRSMSIAFRFLRAKTPEDRAAVDLDTHYTKEYLEEYVGPDTRRAVLHREYVKGICSSGMQSSCGFDGQINACWNHKMTKTEIENIRSAGFLVSVIHGRHDVIAQIHHAERLAAKLNPVARMVDLHGGHLVSHERTEEVNQELLDLIRASEANTSPHEWTDTSPRIAKPLMMGLGAVNTTMMMDRGSSSSSGINDKMCVKYYYLDRLNLIMCYFVGFFALVFDYGRKAVRSILNPSPSVKVQQIQH